MKKKIIIWLIAFCPLNLVGQDIELQIRAIRSEYNTIVANKEKYEVITINVPPQDLFPFDGEGDEPYIKKTITYYIDENKIKLIVVSNECSFPWYTEFEQIEYYLKSNKVFFIYQHYKIDKYSFEDNWDVMVTAIKERRIYYDSNRPIKCLIKEVEGEPSEINFMLNKTTNKEEDCSKLWKIGESLINIFYEENIDSLFGYYRKYGNK